MSLGCVARAVSDDEVLAACQARPFSDNLKIPIRAAVRRIIFLASSANANIVAKSHCCPGANRHDVATAGHVYPQHAASQRGAFLKDAEVAK